MSAVVDKYGSLDRLGLTGPVILELGCGSRKRHAGSLGIDALDTPDVDILGDVFDVLRRFPACSVDRVYSWHFVEHVKNLPDLMLELSRILKPDGLVEIVAPHFSNPYFYSDPTHRGFFGLYTFCYFTVGSRFSRTVPVYQKDVYFRLERVDLRFKSARPFYVRYAIKHLIGKLFNSSYYLKEWYEENLCFLFPCYEVVYRLSRLPEIKEPT